MIERRFLSVLSGEQWAVVRSLFTVRRLLLLSLSAWLLYMNISYSPSMRARVVAPDGAPVAGAIVLTGWTIEEPISSTPLRQAALAEVVTDKDGWFHIPSWGPRLMIWGSIRVDEPTVRIYKPGFIPVVLDNYEDVPMTTASSIIRFRFQDQAITLQPFKGSLVEYENTLRPLLSSLEIVYGGRAVKFCYWRQAPRLLLALQKLKLKLEPQGAGYSLRMAHHYASVAPEVQCGNAEQFFRDYARGQTH